MSDIEAILAEPKPNFEAMRARLRALDALLPGRGDPADAAALIALLRMLYRVARADLPLARLFEGHVDAGQIATRFGMALPDGALLGVWGAALPGEPLRVEDGRHGSKLHGGKAFASGAGVLTHALAGADTAAGNRLVLIDLAASPPAIDRSWWRTIGMQRSETHLVRWDGADAFRFVGKPGDYAREPWFSGGALRFVACHAGGVAALFDRARDHLVASGRAEDPHQAARLARLFGLAQGAAAAVRGAAEWWRLDDAGYPALVATARLQVADAAGRAILLAEEAVGVQAMFEDHPLSAVIADLSVYLRQPAPDAAAMRVAAAAASGGAGAGIVKRLALGGVRRALMVAPHPDDEAIGAWGVIGTLRRRGVPMRVVVVADGAASHPGSMLWPKRRLVAARRRETRAVMRGIGVAAGNVRFVGLPDGRLSSLGCREVTRAVAGAGADLILLPCGRDDHPDHRAVATAAARVRTPGARRFAYLVWSGGRRTRGPVIGHLVAAMAKRAAIRRYRTQCGAIRDDPGGFAIAAHELRGFARPFELFRAVTR